MTQQLNNNLYSSGFQSSSSHITNEHIEFKSNFAKKFSNNGSRDYQNGAQKEINNSTLLINSDIDQMNGI